MSKRTPTVNVVDLFCGAGGTSTGVVQACQRLGVKLDLLAINHWDVAIQTHSSNHPEARHLCTNIDEVDPLKVVPSGRLKLLVASPECIHFSNARGGKPMSDQSRASGWDILRWAEKLYIENILIENVKEFRTWGPLGANGRPLKSKKGATFHAFLEMLRSLGYNVDHKILNAADYGAPTTRERLFIIAKKGKFRKIVWPVPSHTKDGKPIERQFFGDVERIETKKWRPAREIIDWKIQGKSIFDRKKPLAEATIKRIIAGLEKFGGPNAEPFILVLRRYQDFISLDQPLPTITTSGAHFALVTPEPFVIGQQSGASPRSVEDPMPTVATAGAVALVEPYLLRFQGNREKDLERGQTLEDPIGTLDCSNRYGLVEPLLVTVDRQVNNRSLARSVDEPIPTVTGTSRIGIVEPFIVPQFGDSQPRSIDDPLGTITTTSRGIGICEPFIVPQFGEREGQQPRTHSIDDPLPTVTGHGAGALVEPYLINLSHMGDEGHERRCYNVDYPMPTVTGKGQFGVVEASAVAAPDPFVMAIDHTGGSGTPIRSVEDPTVTTEARHAVVEPIILTYNGNSVMQTTDKPLSTVTCKDRFCLIEFNGVNYRIDIRFRMLQPHELAGAMSFPKDYQFKGIREHVVKQIGNAVPVDLAEALCYSVLKAA